jgi:hypothetical protein
MSKLMKEIKYDAEFVRDHELQPGWYKVFKVFLILGLIAGYFLLFGGIKTLVFFGCFFGLSLVVHMIYRIKTKKYSQTWLDFIVEEDDGVAKPKRIGAYYYSAVVINLLISFLISQLLVN